MKTSLLILSLFSVLPLCASITGCASASTTDAATGANASPATAAPAPASDLTGTWGFVLASSDVAAPLRERCAKSSGDDAARSKACWDEIAAEAAQEKIRFGKNASGSAVWTSFAADGKKEIVFVEVPVELAADGPGHVLAKVAGAPRGDHAVQFARSSINVMRIEVIDGKTIAMNDPKKGRLVYTKE